MPTTGQAAIFNAERPTALIVEFDREEFRTHLDRVQHSFVQAGGDAGATRTLTLSELPEYSNATDRFEKPWTVESLSTEQDIRDYILASMDYELSRFTGLLEDVRTNPDYEDVKVINASFSLTEVQFLKEISLLLADDSPFKDDPDAIEALIDRIVDQEDPASASQVGSIYTDLQEQAKALYDDQGTHLVFGAGNSRSDTFGNHPSFESNPEQFEADEDDTLFHRILGDQPLAMFGGALNARGHVALYSSVLEGEDQLYFAEPLDNGTSYVAPMLTAAIQQAHAQTPGVTLADLTTQLREDFQTLADDNLQLANPWIRADDLPPPPPMEFPGGLPFRPIGTN